MIGEQALQVMARYEQGGGIELEGQAEALLGLAILLARGDASTTHPFTVPTDREAAPYDGFVARLRLVTATGPVRVHRDGETLRIEGSAECLATLAQNVEYLAAPADGSEGTHDAGRHIHVEYYDDHPFLSPEAEPLTIVLS